MSGLSRSLSSPGRRHGGSSVWVGGLRSMSRSTSSTEPSEASCPTTVNAVTSEPALTGSGSPSGPGSAQGGGRRSQWRTCRRRGGAPGLEVGARGTNPTAFRREEPVQGLEELRRRADASPGLGHEALRRSCAAILASTRSRTRPSRSGGASARSVMMLASNSASCSAGDKAASSSAVQILSDTTAPSLDARVAARILREAPATSRSRPVTWSRLWTASEAPTRGRRHDRMGAGDRVRSAVAQFAANQALRRPGRATPSIAVSMSRAEPTAARTWTTSAAALAGGCP
jgi:hypothetical protein